MSTRHVSFDVVKAHCCVVVDTSELILSVDIADSINNNWLQDFLTTKASFVNCVQQCFVHSWRRPKWPKTPWSQLLLVAVSYTASQLSHTPCVAGPSRMPSTCSSYTWHWSSTERQLGPPLSLLGSTRTAGTTNMPTMFSSQCTEVRTCMWTWVCTQFSYWLTALCDPCGQPMTKRLEVDWSVQITLP